MLKQRRNPIVSQERAMMQILRVLRMQIESRDKLRSKDKF